MTCDKWKIKSADEIIDDINSAVKMILSSSNNRDLPYQRYDEAIESFHKRILESIKEAG